MTSVFVLPLPCSNFYQNSTSGTDSEHTHLMSRWSTGHAVPADLLHRLLSYNAASRKSPHRLSLNRPRGLATTFGLDLEKSRQLNDLL